MRSVCKVLDCDKCATTAFVKFPTHLRWKRVRKSPREGVLQRARRSSVARTLFLVGGRDFRVIRTANASVAIVFGSIATQMRCSQSKSNRSQRVCVVRKRGSVVRSVFQSFAACFSRSHLRSVSCIYILLVRSAGERVRNAFRVLGPGLIPTIANRKSQIANRKSQIVTPLLRRCWARTVA